MENIENILLEMNEVVSNPKKMVKDYINKTGNKVIGCFPVYCPEELVYAAGMLPVGMWGGQTDIGRAKSQLPAFACSIMQSCLELGMKGAYNDLSGVIIPALCDTLKCIGQNWEVVVPNIEFIPLVHPQNRKIEAGVKFLESQYNIIKGKLEKIAGHKITDEAINSSIKVYNKHRKVMREFSRIACIHPEIITPRKRHLVNKSSFFMDKAKHTELVKKLIDELKKQPEVKWNGKKVILTGIMAEPDKLLDIFEANNLAIVGDDLAQESRQFRTDVKEGYKNPIEALARQWSSLEGCSLAFDPDKKRGQMLIDLVKESNADGVVVCMMKFCDPEEFDYPIYKQELEKADIPNLYIEIDQQMQNNEQARTRIQAFNETLNY